MWWILFWVNIVYTKTTLLTKSNTTFNKQIWKFSSNFELAFVLYLKSLSSIIFIVYFECFLTGRLFKENIKDCSKFQQKSRFKTKATVPDNVALSILLFLNQTFLSCRWNQTYYNASCSNIIQDIIELNMENFSQREN